MVPGKLSATIEPEPYLAPGLKLYWMRCFIGGGALTAY